MYMRRLAVSYSKHLLDNLIVVLFAILPIVDSVNGFLVRQGGISIGSIYKVGLCGILMLPLLRAQRIRGKALGALLAAVLYIAFSVGVNLLLFSAKGLRTDFVIKLLFNIVTLVLLLENYNNGALTGMSFYRMLNFSAWLLPVCYFIPYVLGVGYRVYVGSMGYKAFFIAQNELSLIIIVLFYFCLYKLTVRLRFSALIQTGLLLLCGLLLNTKSTILACLLGAAVCFLYIMVRMPVQVRLAAVVIMVFACVAFYGVIMEVCTAMLQRFTMLMNKHYGGSVLTAVLSGRNYYIESAWGELIEGHFLFRFLFGNGFCSGTLAEMDVVDIFFYLGFFGAVAVVFFLVLVYVKSRKNFKTDPSPIRPLSYLLILFFLNITGHVLFMAMSGCYFVVYLCFLLVYKQQPGEQKQLPVFSRYGEISR